MECLFCSIAKKEIPAEVIYEDAANMAFLDIHPKAPGHTMVIPKVHVENILELKRPDIGPLFGAVKEVTAKLNRVFGPAGFSIGINHGKAGGQVVDHLHVHVIPRFSNDGGGSIHSVVENPPKESIKKIAQKIRGL